MDNLKELILTGWTVRRVFGAVLSVFIVTQAILLKDALLGLLSVYFVYQVVTNTGCFGSAGCAAPIQEKPKHQIPTKKLKL